MERLLFIFGGNFYKWISAPNSYRLAGDSKPKYTTVKGHPIEPRALADLYLDPATLVGLRFGKYTRWAGFDIDAGSILNPLAPHANLTSDKADANLTRLKEAAERHDLIAPVIRRSSHKGGLWLMWAFPQALRTIEVATLLSAIAKEAGFQLKSGQLEAFPNVKPYKKTNDNRKFSQFKAYRLPMQPDTGDMLLDDDLEPVSDDVDVLLNHLKFTASRIDVEEVRRLCALAYEEHVQRLEYRRKSRKNARTAWIAELERITAQGFTAHHQTNALLGKLACLGIVRDGLKGCDLAAFIEETAVAMPGYKIWCRHQHEIGPRSREWAASGESFYWHIDDPDKTRQGSYRDMFDHAGAGSRENKAAAYHQRRGNETLEQLTRALEALQGRSLSTLNELFKAVCEKAKELFGKAFSKRTWVKYREQVATLIAGLIQPMTQVETVSPTPTEAPAQPPVIDPPKNPETQAESQSTHVCRRSRKWSLLKSLKPRQRARVPHVPLL